MDIAFIVPTKYLNEYESEGTISFVEALPYLEDSDYRNYYLEKKAEGKFTILDNSMFLRDEPLEDKMLIQVMKDLKPNIIIAPDTAEGWKESIQRTEEFLKTFRKARIKFDIQIMGVLHGTNLSECAVCCDILLSHFKEITAIGIPYITWKENKDRPLQELAKFRLTLTDFLDFNEYITSIKRDIYVHLLGTSDPVAELPNQLKHEWIRSVDSASAFTLGYNNIKLTSKGWPEFKRELKKVDFTSDMKLRGKKKKIIEHNISTYKMLIRSNTNKQEN